RDGGRMRFVVVASFISALMVGVGYPYSQERPISTFLTVPIERGRISTLVKATGTVEAAVSVDDSSELSRRIADVSVNFKDSVKAGEAIAQIDQDIFAARVNEAKAALDVAMAATQAEQAALEKAKVAIANARTAKELAEAQSAADQTRQEELERDFQ